MNFKQLNLLPMLPSSVLWCTVLPVTVLELLLMKHAYASVTCFWWCVLLVTYAWKHCGKNMWNQCCCFFFFNGFLSAYVVLVAVGFELVAMMAASGQGPISDQSDCEIPESCLFISQLAYMSSFGAVSETCTWGHYLNSCLGWILEKSCEH